MSEYNMGLKKHNCGPCVISAATDKSLPEVEAAMRWGNYEDTRDDLNDNPANHFLALQRLGVPYRVVTAGQIMRGECKSEKTIILIHGEGIIGSWLAQHWVLLAGVGADKVTIHMGDGSDRSWSFAGFQAAYSRGGPTATAYEVFPETPKPVTRWNVFARLFRWAFGR